MRIFAVGFNDWTSRQIYKKMTKPLHITKKGTGKEISKLLGISEHTVSFAIRGKIDTPTARKIRKIAKENYGAIEIDI